MSFTKSKWHVERHEEKRSLIGSNPEYADPNFDAPAHNGGIYVAHVLGPDHIDNAELIAAAGRAATALDAAGYDAMACIEKMSELLQALEVVMPMAKGYASAHQVGRNAEMVAQAEALLSKTRK